MSIARCEKCGALIEVIPCKAHRGEIEATYLQCPVCYEVYPALISDPELRRMIFTAKHITHRCNGKTLYRQMIAQRAEWLKRKHGKSLKSGDGWTLDE